MEETIPPWQPGEVRVLQPVALPVGDMDVDFANIFANPKDHRQARGQAPACSTATG